MVVEDSLAPLVTCHVTDTLVIANGLATEGETNTRVIVLANFATL